MEVKAVSLIFESAKFEFAGGIWSSLNDILFLNSPALVQKT